jgi:hypothetical protein
MEHVVVPAIEHTPTDAIEAIRLLATLLDALRETQDDGHAGRNRHSEEKPRGKRKQASRHPHD